MDVSSRPDDQLLNAYSSAVERLGTTDLVLYVDLPSGDLDAIPRSTCVHDFARFLGDVRGSSEILRQLSRSATAALGLPEGTWAFWLLVTLSNGQMLVVAVSELLGGTS
jgi:hypothetical protein